MIFIRQQFELVLGLHPPQQIEFDDSFHNGKICPDYLYYSKNKSNKYPEINIYYGPYECNRITKYRPEKLDGLITCLKRKSYNVKLIPFGILNTVEVVSMKHLIYRFDIRILKFNMPTKDDPACIKALNVINEAIARLYGANNFTTKRMPKHREARATTISITSKISLSEYGTLLDIMDL